MLKSKKLLLILFALLYIYALPASDQSENILQEYENRECVLSSMIVGGSIGGLCGLLDRKLAPTLFTTLSEISTAVQINNPNECPMPEFSKISSIPFTWIGSFIAFTTLIYALHHERNSSRATRSTAMQVAHVSSWIAWTAVFVGLGADARSNLWRWA